MTTAVQQMLDGPTREDQIKADARKAWRRHPEFVDELVRLAREDRRFHPDRKVSIGELFVVAARNLRQVGIDVRPNHNWRKTFTDLLMHHHADLEGAFTTRDSLSAHVPPHPDTEDTR